MAGVLDLMGYVQKQGDMGRERGQQSRLASLASQAYGAAPDAQRGIVQQAIATNPTAGFNLAGELGKSQDRDFSQLGQAAAIFATVPDDQKQEFYATKVAPLAHQLGFKVPTTYDPRMQPMIDKVAQLAGGVGTGGNVQSTYIDAQGNRVAIMRDGTTQVLGQNAPSNQIIDTGNGFFGVNKTNLQAAPVMVGGPPQQMAPGEVPFSIDPSLPPQVQASIRANESAYAAVPDGGQVQIGPQGQQLRSAPKPEAQGDVFVPLSQDEVAQMGLPAGTIAQRNLKTGKVEFGPTAMQPGKGEKPTATQMRLANTAKAKLVDLNAIEAQLNRVEQAFAPLKDSYSAGPFGAGYLPTEGGKRFDNAVALLAPLVRKLTRTPGEGSMSDYESKLAQLANPSRNQYESVTGDQLAQLRELIGSIRQGYQALLEDNGGNDANLSPAREAQRPSQAPTSPAGWSIQVVP